MIIATILFFIASVGKEEEEQNPQGSKQHITQTEIIHGSFSHISRRKKQCISFIFS